MAKRKKRKTTKKQTLELKKEVYAIFIIIATIMGLGKLGPVGKMVASFSLFVTGSAYMITLVLLLLVGVYTFFKGEWPEFFSTKFFGFYLVIIGLLSFMHWDFISLNNGNSSLIFRETLNELSKGFNNLMQTGTVNDTIAVGGGLIGGVFALIFCKLFSILGMKIISITFIVIGISLFTGFSISEFVSEKLSVVKEKKEKHNLQKQEKDDQNNDEDNHLLKKKVKISNGNEIEEVEKPTIKSIDELKKINTEANTNVEEKKEEIKQQNLTNTAYQLPPLDLLNKPKKNSVTTDNSAIEANIEKLEKVLSSFNVSAKVVEVHIGPTVAQYELEIASGTRVNKITTLSREIALALSKKDVRIEAPIPGKSTVGVEFANEKATPVSFYEIMASKIMQQNQDKKLMVPLGKSIMGDIGVCEVNKMPHMLIAGTTGSGKSVCVNGIICSILMRAKPDEVKLAMVDPKVVELSVYNGIPHLMCPVVSDPKQAAILLQKMVAAKEVEDSILRITQKARAAGIHLIVATQRPSTEVITGLIKANIPSRIAFAVGSGIDSRTILDQVGAEKLLGKGDMFFLPIGQNTPTRVQGSFINDDEIKKIIDFTIEQQKAQYDDSFMNLEIEKEAKDDIDMTPSDAQGDNLYDEITDFVIKTQKASASLLQRKFKIGYNKAATMIDKLEEDGIIGPATGNSKPREVLIQYSETDDE